MADPKKPDKKMPKKPGSFPPNAPRPNRTAMMWVVLIVGGLLMASLLAGSGEGREMSTTEFTTYLNGGNIVGEVKIKGDQLNGELAKDVPLEADESRKFFVKIDPEDKAYKPSELDRRLQEKGNTAQVTRVSASWYETWLPQLLLMVLLFGLMWFFLFRRMGGGGGGMLGNFGRSKHRLMTKEESKITFDDVAGIQEAKEEVSEIVEFLKNSEKFQRLGGRVPRGVLLVGEPGCGKTLLAKAIAGEADVPFFSISGSDFVEMFVGVGASRVRDLFKQAKESSPCIIFLDEIDAVGRKRGVGFSGGGHDEREQTLNAILVEMDGFDRNDQVIVCAATNRADVLDPALTRPGRFDRQVVVPLPDVQGRQEVLAIYAAKVKMGPDVDLTRLARGTSGFSGADLEALVNEAAIAAAMQEKDFIEQADVEEARDKVRWGRSRRSRTMDELELKHTAYHEAGHALIALLTPHTDPLHKVSIIPRGQAAGATYSLPEKDRTFYTQNYCKEELIVLYAGRIAEELVSGDISSGASSDIAQATRLAKTMVLDWGMSERLSPINYAVTSEQTGPYDMGERKYSERTAVIIDEEIKRIVDEAYDIARTMLNENREKLEAIAQALLKYETLDADDVQRLADGKTISKPTVAALLATERQATLDAVAAQENPDTLSPPALPG